MMFHGLGWPSGPDNKNDNAQGTNGDNEPDTCANPFFEFDFGFHRLIRASSLSSVKLFREPILHLQSSNFGGSNPSRANRPRRQRLQ